MSHAIELSDKAYETLQERGTRQGQTATTVMEALLEAALSDGPFYETEDWFRHLRMTDDDIREARRLADENIPTHNEEDTLWRNRARLSHQQRIAFPAAVDHQVEVAVNRSSGILDVWSWHGPARVVGA